ncbi:MAG: hypothetical protein GX979_03260, partial [Firmicutes bacterium]|nr:hypothetical protein [Bacillota bacterium]
LGHKNEEERESAARSLLDYGFRKYQSLKLYSQNDVVGALESPTGRPRVVDVILPADFFVTVERGKELDLTTVISLDTNQVLPIREGQVVGSITAYFGEEVVGTSLLTISEPVQKLTLVALVWRLGQAIAKALF